MLHLRFRGDVTMDNLNIIAGYCGSISAIIALVVLVVKPVRNRFVDWITKTSNRDELNSKIDNLTELVEKQVTQNDIINAELQKQSMALQASLRNSILVIYNDSIAKGHMTMFEKQNLSKLFCEYKNLQGNSFICDLVNELNDMPVKND